MARYIDADKLKKHYSWWKAGDPRPESDILKMIFNEIVDKQPTADVAEVVRCKDCVHGSPDGNGYRCDQVPCLSWKADDFCSKGRRKENEPMG